MNLEILGNRNPHRNHIINDQVSYTISLKNCKENPLFLMFEQGGGESSKKETYLVTYSISRIS